MTTAWVPVLTDELAEPVHMFTRYGRDIPIRVLEIPGGLGHALVFGEIRDDCLVRVHSRCLYGDVLRSDDCDCGPELQMAMDMIQVEGNGILFYLEQEGRGAGLVNKARGYSVSQREGLHTFASYAKLGYSPDSRTYADAAATLKELGLQSIRLLTNNPQKEHDLLAAGLTVRCIPLHTIPRSRAAREYLRAKRQYRNHRLPAHWWTHRVLHGVGVVAGVVVFGGIVAVLPDLVPLGSLDGFERALLAISGLLAVRLVWRRAGWLRARIRVRGSRWIARERPGRGTAAAAASADQTVREQQDSLLDEHAHTIGTVPGIDLSGTVVDQLRIGEDLVEPHAGVGLVGCQTAAG